MLSQNIRNLRKIRGLTQTDLGEKLGYRHSTIAGYESGRTVPTGDILEKIAKALNVSIAELYSGETNNNVNADEQASTNMGTIMMPRNIKNARRNKGLTQKQLGDILGVSHSTIAGYESGNAVPSIDKLSTIAKATGVSIEWLSNETTEYHNGKSSIARNIRNHRVSNKLTQSELGDKVGAIHATISNYETGRVIPDSEMLKKLSDALSTSVESLLYEESSTQSLPSTTDGTLQEVIEILRDNTKIMKAQQELLREMQGNISKLIDMIKP